MFLGMAGYYRRFIEHFSHIARPLTQLTQKNRKFSWGAAQESAVQTLKDKLVTAPVLAHFNEHAVLEIHTDASSKGISAILHQRVDNVLQVVAYASRTYSPAEANYNTSEQECLAVIWGIAKYRKYIFPKPIKIVVDHHALCSLQFCKNPRNAILAVGH